MPINTAMRIIENLKDYGTPRHGYIGVEFSPRGATDVWGAECGSTADAELDMDAATLELIVRSLPTIMNVTPLAPADRHGLKPGDVIFLVDGELAVRGRGNRPSLDPQRGGSHDRRADARSRQHIRSDS